MAELQAPGLAARAVATTPQTSLTNGAAGGRGSPKAIENALSGEVGVAQFERVAIVHQLLGVLKGKPDQHHPIERSRAISRDLNHAPAHAIWANVERKQHRTPHQA